LIKTGAVVLFEDVAREFVRDPFMLTFEVESALEIEKGSVKER